MPKRVSIVSKPLPKKKNLLKWCERKEKNILKRQHLPKNYEIFYSIFTNPPKEDETEELLQGPLESDGFNLSSFDEIVESYHSQIGKMPEFEKIEIMETIQTINDIIMDKATSLIFLFLL